MYLKIFRRNENKLERIRKYSKNKNFDVRLGWFQ